MIIRVFDCLYSSTLSCVEIAIVSESLDSLASALDLIEERADRIRAQLLELLTSNREILSSLREENTDALQEDEPQRNTQEGEQPPRTS